MDEAPVGMSWRLVVRRLVAGVIDGALVMTPAVGSATLIVVLYEPEGRGMEALGVAVVAIFLFVGLALAVPPAAAAAFANRRSPGRRVARLDVVRSGGEPLLPWVAGARALVLVPGFFVPYGWVVVPVAALITLAWKGATWWDLVTRTRVVPTELRTSPAPTPPRLLEGLRVAAGWLVAVPWLLFAVLAGAGGDWVPVGLASVAVGAVVWLLWRKWGTRAGAEAQALADWQALVEEWEDLDDAGDRRMPLQGPG